MKPRGDVEPRSAVQVIGASEPQDANRAGKRFSVMAVFLLFAISLAGLVAIIGTGSRGETPVRTEAPRPLSEPEPVTIDARTDPALSSNSVWAEADLELGTRLSKVVATHVGFVAAGIDPGGPGLWASENGSRWELIGRLERPPAVQEWTWRSVSEPRLFAEWQGSLLTIAWVGNEGPAVWLDTAFGGYITGLDSFTSAIVPGNALIAATAVEVEPSPEDGYGSDRQVLVVSDNGVDWSDVTTVGLPDSAIPYVAGFAGGHFYATVVCGTADCPPGGPFRSADGLEWQPADFESAGSEPGFLASVADVGGRFLAVGAVNVAAAPRPAVWSSVDGEHWSLRDLGDSLQPPATTVELIAVNPDTRESATVAVDGKTFDLPEDSVVETDVGSITIATVNSDSIRLTVGDGRSMLVDINERISLDRVAYLQEVAGSGERVAIRGFLLARATGEGGFVPVIWLSEDGGETWATETPASGEGTWTESMAVSETGIVVIGSSENEARSHVWYYDRADN